MARVETWPDRKSLMKRAWILAALSALVTPSVAMARPSWASGTFVYANLCTETNGGALSGHRIVLRRWPNGNEVTFETAAGTAVKPIPAGAVSIDDATQEISFTVESGSGALVFRGTAASTVLAGTLVDQGGERPLRLRRVLRSHEREDCRSINPDPEATASLN